VREVRHPLGRALAILGLLAVAVGSDVRAEGPATSTIPAAVAGSIEASELATTGRFTVHLVFTVEEDVERALPRTAPPDEQRRRPSPSPARSCRRSSFSVFSLRTAFLGTHTRRSALNEIASR
jgi:hypothetical protein